MAEQENSQEPTPDQDLPEDEQQDYEEIYEQVNVDEVLQDSNEANSSGDKQPDAGHLGIDDINAYISQAKERKSSRRIVPESADGTKLEKLPDIYGVVPHAKGDHKIVYLQENAPDNLKNDPKDRKKGTTYTKNGQAIYEVKTTFKKHPELKNNKNELLDVWVIARPTELQAQLDAIKDGKGGGTNFGTPVVVADSEQADKEKETESSPGKPVENKQGNEKKEDKGKKNEKKEKEEKEEEKVKKGTPQEQKKQKNTKNQKNKKKQTDTKKESKKKQSTTKEAKNEEKTEKEQEKEKDHKQKTQEPQSKQGKETTASKKQQKSISQESKSQAKQTTNNKATEKKGSSRSTPANKKETKGNKNTTTKEKGSTKKNSSSPSSKGTPDKPKDTQQAAKKEKMKEQKKKSANKQKGGEQKKKKKAAEQQTAEEEKASKNQETEAQKDLTPETMREQAKSRKEGFHLAHDDNEKEKEQKESTPPPTAPSQKSGAFKSPDEAEKEAREKARNAKNEQAPAEERTTPPQAKEKESVKEQAETDSSSTEQSPEQPPEEQAEQPAKKQTAVVDLDKIVEGDENQADGDQTEKNSSGGISRGLIIRGIGAMVLVALCRGLYKVMFTGGFGAQPDEGSSPPPVVETGSEDQQMGDTPVPDSESNDESDTQPDDQQDSVPSPDEQPAETDSNESPSDTGTLTKTGSYTLNELQIKLESQEQQARKLLNRAKFIENQQAIKFSMASLIRAGNALETIETDPTVTASEIEKEARKIDLYLQEVKEIMD